MNKQVSHPIVLPVLFVLAANCCVAETVEYDLTIAREEVEFTGKSKPALTINGEIPGPVLEFTEGDYAVLRVHNELEVSTSIHWHGLLVPPGMDGVPYVSFPPIEPGTTFTYRFPIRQAGTYWYHSHSELQEQKGLYGAIVIHPRQPRHRVDHDVPVVLSDWSDESTHEIIRTLRRGSEWYSIKKGTAISLLEGAKYGMLGEFFQRELVRMPTMDISDVYYDRFLANGSGEFFVDAEPGELVRLRLIDGSATTFFYGEFAGAPMTIISADGQPVEPIRHDRLLMGVAETYDVIVRVPEGGGTWEFRATAHDATGHASIWIGDRSGNRHHAPDVPVPNLYYAMGKPTIEKVFALTPAGTMGMPDRKVEAGKFDTPGMSMNMDMADMGHGAMGGMKPANAMNTGLSGEPPHEEEPRAGRRMNLPDEKHAADHGGMGMSMSMGPRLGGPIDGPLFKNGREMVVDGMNPERPLPPYPKLKAVHSTAPDPNRPVREIRLTLDGDMERYVWYLNNKALHETDQIRVREGEVVRFIMINRTMMYHPMHLHGQFFRVINGQGDRSPLKHTVIVTPMATTVFEFEASEVGDWFFHCHLLYHMHSGMARVVEYEQFDPDPATASVRDELYTDTPYFYGGGDFLSHMTEGVAELSGIRYSALVGWEVGWGEVEDTEHEIDLLANYYHDRFLSLFAGAQLSNSEAYPDGRGIFGFRYPLPLLLGVTGWIDTEGEFRFLAEKSYPITDRLHVFGELQYDSRLDYEWAAGLEYVVSKELSITGNYHSEFGVGGGLSIRF